MCLYSNPPTHTQNKIHPHAHKACTALHTNSTFGCFWFSFEASVTQIWQPCSRILDEEQ